jgi:hypothetical protein
MLETNCFHMLLGTHWADEGVYVYCRECSRIRLILWKDAKEFKRLVEFYFGHGLTS